MALRSRATVYDPTRWIDAVEIIENLADVMGSHRPELSRLRSGQAIVVTGDLLWRPGDPMDLLHEEDVCLEPDGSLCSVTPLCEGGLIIDYHRADGTLVGYSDPDPPVTLPD